MISFGISLAAPGNAVRKAEQPNAPNAPMAILESFYFSLRYISRFSTITVLFVLSLLCPFIYRIASKLKFSFKYPFAFLFFSFCFFTAQFTPPVWGYSTPGSGRIFNIYFFSYFWFVLSNIFYFCGYISKKKKFNIDAVFAHLKKPRTLACASVLLVIMLAIPLTLDLNDWDTWDRKKFTSVNAVYSLVTGDAQQYDREYKERLAVYHDDSVQQVEFQPFTKTPPLLFYGDMTQDADFQWSNKPLREYYDKEYVIVIWN